MPNLVVSKPNDFILHGYLATEGKTQGDYITLGLFPGFTVDVAKESVKTI